MPVIGKRTTGTVSHQFLADGRTSQQDNNLVLSSAGSAAWEDGHAYSMGIRAGSESGTTCSTILVAYGEGGPSGVSSAILKGRTANIAVTQDWDTNKPIYEVDLLETFLIQDGIKYYPGFLETNGLLEIGKDGTSGSAGHPTNDRTSDTPPDPFGSFPGYQFLNGNPYVWINYEANVAPDIPSDFSPADAATVTDTTPDYSADFTDANQIMPNGLTSDYMVAYQIQVRSVSAENATSGTVVWDSGTVAASVAERDASRFTKTHGGSALSLGTRYQWRARTQDRFGSWSAWSHADAAAWSDFLVASGGVVTLDGTPNGRTTDTTPDFQGRYHHVSGTAADRVQIQLYTTDANGNNPVLQATSAEITKAVSSSALPGTLFTITAAESGFGTLASGVDYGYKIRARTSAGAWSDYSALRTFFTNAKPTTPTNLRPTGGAASSSFPLLTAQVTDPDGDALTVSVRIKDSGGSVLFTRSATFDATLYSGAGGYKYQTNGTDLASFATYRHDWSATDGDLTSDQSAESTFVYAEGPSVTVTSPTENEVITTDTPTFTWTTTDQQKRRTRVYRESDDSLVHDSTQIVSTVSSYAMPPDVLVNETDYYVTIEVENSAPLTGTSAARNFRLEYVSPATVLGFVATPETAEFDQYPSVNRLEWDAVETDSSLFEGYVIYGRNAGQEFAQAVVLVELPSRDQNTWIDDTVQSGVSRVYSIVQKVRESSIDVLTSEPAESTAIIALKGSVISDARDGMSLRAVFDSVQDKVETVVTTQTELETWDGGAPWLLEGVTYYKPITIQAQLYRNTAAEVDAVLEALRGAPYEPYPLVPPYGGLSGVRADGSPVLSCYRDERKIKLFGRVRNVEVTYRRLMRADVQFDFFPVNYDERVV